MVATVIEFVQPDIPVNPSKKRKQSDLNTPLDEGPDSIKKRKLMNNQ